MKKIPKNSVLIYYLCIAFGAFMGDTNL